MVTSSAVVGSSAISSAGCRPAPSRSSPAGACRRRTGAGSRGRALGVGMRTSCSISTARSAQPAQRQALVQARITSAICSPTVNTGFRLVIGSWKTIAISLARILCISAPAGHQVAPATDLPATMRARRHVDQLHHRLRGDALAAARFADHADRLAAVDRQIDAVDRVHHAVVGLEVGLQARISSRFPTMQSPTRRGSSASRSPSPMKLIDSTVMKIASPGTAPSARPCPCSPSPSYRMRPQVGMSGGKPRPEERQRGLRR